jgi:hypothetical protein
MKHVWKGLWLLLALIWIGGAVGCSTTDAENRAERPWNAPANWEFGLPPEMMQGR